MGLAESSPHLVIGVVGEWKAEAPWRWAARKLATHRRAASAFHLSVLISVLLGQLAGAVSGGSARRRLADAPPTTPASF